MLLIWKLFMFVWTLKIQRFIDIVIISIKNKINQLTMIMFFQLKENGLDQNLHISSNVKCEMSTKTRKY